MTHLRIEQSTGSIEEVTLPIISKLYELVYAGLDASSNLQGRLHTPVSYRAEVQYLTANYPELYITSDDYAIPFEDPNMVTYLNSIGVGSNGTVTEAQAAAATVVANSANTTVTKFNELKYFTGITQSRGGWTGGASGDAKFVNWTALEEIDISNYTSLGHRGGYGYEDAFQGCTALKKVTASDKLTKIGFHAFYGCSNLEQITGLSGNIEISDLCFFNCTKLTDASIVNVTFDFALENSTVRGGQAFGSTKFTQISISPNATIIPDKVFSDCSELQSVTGLGNIVSIYSEVFKNNTKLTTLDIDWTKITQIRASAFNGCQLLPIPALSCPSLSTLNGDAFRNCKQLQTVTNLGNVVEVGQNAFNNCTSLTSVTIPSTLVKLYSAVFYGCTSLTTITIPNGYNTTLSLGNQVFYNDQVLTSSIPPSINFWDTGHQCFYNCRALQFPNNFTVSSTHSGGYIGPSAFQNCTGLTAITLDSSIKVLDYCAFCGCSNLTTITGTQYIEKIGQSTFEGCTSLTGTLDLSNCTGFRIGYINGVNNELSGVFHGCGATKIILGDWDTIPRSWTAAQTDRPFFNECANLTTVDFKSLTSFPNYRNGSGYSAFFRNCPNMTTFILRQTTPSPMNNDSDVLQLVDIGGAGVTVYVPDASVNDYKSAAGWSNIASNIKGISELPST